MFYLHLLFAGLLVSQNDHVFSKHYNSPSTDSLITSLVSEINMDSIRSHIQSLQDFKTRMTLAPNKDSVVNWLVNKFKSFGLTDVEIDTSTSTFPVWPFGEDRVPNLQKNVVATLKGTVYPNDVFVIGGHYDSHNNIEDPMISAPGADDNASGVSSVLECARTIMKNGYKPNATIKFVAYDGEEGGSPSGSDCFAKKILGEGKQVILSITSDVIANSTQPLSNSLVSIFYTPSDYPLYINLAKSAAPSVSVLSLDVSPDRVGNDNEEFGRNKIPTIDFMEEEFSRFWHTSNDLVENLNMEYCTEVVKITCATLISAIESNVLPKPIYKFTAQPKLHSIELNLSTYTNGGIQYGFNLYRGLTQQGEKTKINSEVIKDTSYIDNTTQDGIYYFYEAKTVDSSGIETNYNKTAWARAISLDQGVLVVDETVDGTGVIGYPSDEQVDSFYTQLLPNFNKRDYDVTKDGDITLSDLGAFSTVLWHGNDYSNLLAYKNIEDIKKYLAFGGKLLLDSYVPSKTLTGNLLYKVDYSPGDLMYDVFKIKGVERKPNTFFFGAQPLDPTYNLLEVDTTKTKSNYNFHINTIESISAAPGAKAIYTYNTRYDSATTQGSMKGMPVGVEYLGADYKVITLSFPLYYMTQEQAQALVQDIMLNKFNEVTAVKSEDVKILPTEYFLYQNYPNPFNPITKIKFSIPSSESVNYVFVQLKVFDILGKEISTLVNEKKNAGSYQVEFNSHNLPTGVYLYRLSAGNFVSTMKMILMK